MRTSQKGIDLMKSFEGCRLASYKCPAGVWTIGYGHTAGVKAGQVITQTQAETFLRNDLVKYEGYVAQNVKLSLNQGQFDALVSFAYNCGVGNLRTLVKNRNHGQIANALLRYNKAAGKVLSGLTRRRKAEQKLFLAGVVSVEQPNVEYYPKCAPNQTGIAAALKSIGVDGSYAYRCKIAAKNGIVGYRGTAEQNVKMLGLLKCGKLVKA